MSKKITVADIVAAIDCFAPFHLAESWDNVGLQIGDPKAAASHVMMALDVTSDIIAQAKRKKADVLLVHHPLIFRPMKSVTSDNTIGRLVSELLAERIALIAAHTNLDAVAVGTNGELADRLGLMTAGRQYLLPNGPTTDQVKYVVYTPIEYAERLIEAFHTAGAAGIGNYSHCTFRTQGTGTFKPLEGAQPFLGKVGAVEHAEEVRLECLCPKSRLSALLAEVRKVHPYEEIAYDVLPIVPTGKPTSGLGLIGELPTKTTLSAFANAAAKAVGCKRPAIVGSPKKPITSVAICSGAGGEAIRRWKDGTADVFVTGELSHHDCMEAKERGIAVVLVGHWQSEVIVGPRLVTLLTTELADAGFAPIKYSVAKEEPPLERL